MTSELRFYDPGQLVDRWGNRVGKKTLANWRAAGQGPRFTKIGSRILYPLADVLAYEADRNYATTQDYGKKRA